MNSTTTSGLEPLSVGALLPALVVAIAGLGVGGAASYAPPSTGEMAVVFAPWVGEGDVLAAIVAAGGSLAGSTRLGNVAVAYASDPDFANRVRDRGALFTLSAQALCGTVSATYGFTE